MGMMNPNMMSKQMMGMGNMRMMNPNMKNNQMMGMDQNMMAMMAKFSYFSLSIIIKRFLFFLFIFN